MKHRLDTLIHHYGIVSVRHRGPGAGDVHTCMRLAIYIHRYMIRWQEIDRWIGRGGERENEREREKERDRQTGREGGRERGREKERLTISYIYVCMYLYIIYIVCT